MFKQSIPALLALPLLAQPVATKPAQPQPVQVQPQVMPGQPVLSSGAPVLAPIDPEKVIARVGTRVIREKDFQSWLKAMVGQKQADLILKNPSSLEHLRQRYFDTEALATLARKEGVQKLPEYKDMVKVQENQVLVRLLMTEEREGSAGSKLKAKVENPSDEEIRAYFDKNAARYETPEKFTARHIRINVKKSAVAAEQPALDEEAKAKIAKIQADLKAGKTFEAVAKEVSDDASSKQNGGLMKDATYGRFGKAFDDAVKSQELNKVGEPVKTDYGFELIVVEGRTEKQSAAFDAVKDRVKAQMIPERRESLAKAYVEDVRKEIGMVTGAEAAEAPAKAAKPAAKKADKK